MVSTAWAMASGGGGQQANPMVNFIFLGILFVIFWVFLIQPQRRQQKEHEKLVSGVKKGDKIITQGGIHATIASVKSATVVAKVEDGTKLEFDKTAITRIVNPKKDT